MTNPGPVAPRRTRLRPLGPDEVRLGDGTWGAWQRRTGAVTLRHGIRMLEREGALDNLRRLVGRSAAPFRGMVFQDSDVHKMLEAVAWELGRVDDPVLRAFFDETVSLLEGVQRDDGYLNSAFQRDDAPAPVWTDFAHGHELYCAGHLIQAGVAARRAMGDDRLLAVAVRLADHIAERFGGADSSAYPGHPEIEYALVELYRLTGDRRHLDTARAFIDRRGAGWLGPGMFGAAYLQDDAPVRETTTLRGHAVRALYLNAGATDVAIETGDDELLAVMRAQWDDLVARRMYLTGGTGSRHRDEAFGDAYELPPDRSYSETCAGIALLHWGWRMLLATGDSRYLEPVETALYNVVAAGIGDDGASFFYSNPLQLRGDHVAGQEEATARRLPWYACACCPPNLMRTFASIEALVAVAAPGELRIANYTRAHIDTDAPGARVVLDVDTDYPQDSRVRIAVHEMPSGVTLLLRMPQWCRRADLRVDGAARAVDAREGWVRIAGPLAPGTVIELSLEMPVDVVAAHPRADAVRGTVAVRRGPVVYCLEQRDNTADIESCLIDPAAVIRPGTTGATALGPLLHASGVSRDLDAAEPLYAPWPRPARPLEAEELTLRPYATWGNAAPGAMRVWIPLTAADDRAAPLDEGDRR